MPRFENLIVAVDGSGASEQMAQSLLKLPAFEVTKVTLLHAVSSQISAEQMASQWKQGQDLLATALQTLVVKPGTAVTSQLIEGDPKLVVSQMAESLPQPLIVMGSRGRSRLAAILQNSVSQYIFQLSSCPMLLVRDEIFVHAVKRVMVAVDASPGSQQALAVALDLVQGIPGVQIFLARVQRQATDPAQDEVLVPVIARLKRQQISYKVFPAVGDAGVEITRLAKESGSDLLVMGSPDRRPTIARTLPDLDRLLGKSTSDYVRVHIECPVLMVRSSQDRD